MYILDTHILLWLVSAQAELTEKVKTVIHSNPGNLYVSSISAFEIAIKHIKNKLQLPISPDVWFQKAISLHGLDELTINSEILIQSATLPAIHNDPADRIIISTAIIHNATIITRDKLIPQYPGIKVLWD